MLDTYYSVGKVYPSFIGHQECTMIDVDNAGIVFYIFYNDMTEEESANLGSGHRFDIRFTEFEDMIMFSIKPGELDWMDAPYSPHLGASKNGTPNTAYNKDEGILLTLIGVDSRTGEIKNLRAMGMGTDFSNSLLNSINKLKSKSFNKMVFDTHLQTIYKTFSSAQLAYKAKHRFTIEAK